MNTPSNRRRVAAFTLIEVLTVVAIVAMLATMTYAGLQYAMTKSKQKQTLSTIHDINRSVEEYKNERGNYPRPAIDKKDQEVSINGESWVAGPAMALYQMLSGDGTDAMRGGEKASTGVQGSAMDDKDPGMGKIYMSSVVAPNKKQIEDKVKLDLVEASGETYYLIDAWRHPFRYQVQELDKNGLSSNLSEMFSSANFEIWSYGTLKKPEDNEDAQREWLKSWTAGD